MSFNTVFEKEHWVSFVTANQGDVQTLNFLTIVEDIEEGKPGARTFNILHLAYRTFLSSRAEKRPLLVGVAS